MRHNVVIHRFGIFYVNVLDRNQTVSIFILLTYTASFSLHIKETHIAKVEVSDRFPFILFLPEMFRLEFIFLPSKYNLPFSMENVSLISKLVSDNLLCTCYVPGALLVMGSQQVGSITIFVRI